MDGLKQWKCKNGHVLGVIQRVKGDYGHVSRLMLFRQALDLSVDGKMEDVDVIANIEGTTLDVRCSVPGCNEMRSWFMGADVMDRLVEKAQAARAVARAEA